MATELKNVLVIGLGLGGAPAAKELARDLPATHRVVAISEKSFAFFPVASLRAAVGELAILSSLLARSSDVSC